jgi:GntR family transcriptional repressor for pyruvate dehydrogenase complex
MASERAQIGLEEVFGRLLRALVEGRYGEGRLPAERELAASLGTSRATLREALRRLSAWELVEARRGSGIVALPRRRWSIEVLPAYIQYGAGRPGEPGLGVMVRDLLWMRRSLLVQLTRLLAGRVAPDALAPARAALARAWDARAGGVAFVEADLEMTRAVVEAAQVWPAVWALNRFSGVYLGLARPLAAALGPHEGYRETFTGWLDALARGDGERAAALLEDWLDRHDARLLGALGEAP